VEKDRTVYIPKVYIPASSNFFGQEIPERWEEPINSEIADKYYKLKDDPAQADFAIVVISTPICGRTAGYNRQDAEKGGNGFIPISLQYKKYTASEARDPSLAGDPRENDVLNRTYRNKSVEATNRSDLDLVLSTCKAMQGKPVVVILKMSNPTVVSGFEKMIDALLINFGVQDQAILDIISGNDEPSGLLPLQMPSGMSTVETQKEDLPFDMIPHEDSEGNVYDFGFGLNWNGAIMDHRTDIYKK